MEETSKKQENFFRKNIIILSLIIFLLFLISIIYFLISAIIGPGEKLDGPYHVKDLKQFNSEEEFFTYLNSAMELEEVFGHSFSGTRQARPTGLDASFEISAPGAYMADSPATTISPERYSETNVQVEGVDEPDIVKTDGINIYASLGLGGYQGRYYYPKELKTQTIKAFPVDELGLINEIDEGGKLLLSDNFLIIFQKENIKGYNVFDPKNPEEKWKIDFNEETGLVGARLQDNVIYLIVLNHIYIDQSCSFKPLTIDGNDLNIDCTSIYYPGKIIPANAIYTIVAIDLKTGEEKENISFVGSASNSVIYMSYENIYLSYFIHFDLFEFFFNFFEEECSDIFPADIIERIGRLAEYDIGYEAKMTEIATIMENYYSSLPEKELFEFYDTLEERMAGFHERKKRQLESTGIVKIDLAGLRIKAFGAVPGILLNQFALDEYRGNLRVATTIGESFFGAIRETVNDVYILGEDLKEIGSVKDLGLEERIYSVRFIEDKGYVVTFREIDPFYVLDLSNPTNPEMKGELKIPGYSSYLHPAHEDKIIGIGKEGFNVKVSLFDVSNPYDPKEIDKYHLNDYWSEIINNHHAFLLDSRHKIFFLPGNRGGYIFSFDKNKINLIKFVEQRQVRRAIYIDDYLYIISQEKIIVLNQKNWEIVKEIDL